MYTHGPGLRGPLHWTKRKENKKGQRKDDNRETQMNTRRMKIIETEIKRRKQK